jgi:hypothetical protein
MQAHERLGNSAEARRAAERIVEQSPEGPHAGSARELLKR